jgi:hypothetical protein
MAEQKRSFVNEDEITKGQRRKLNALCKSVGKKIGNKTFAEWLFKSSTEGKRTVDNNAEVIAKHSAHS